MTIEIGEAVAGKLLKTRSRESEVKFRKWWQDFSKHWNYAAVPSRPKTQAQADAQGQAQARRPTGLGPAPGRGEEAIA